MTGSLLARTLAWSVHLYTALGAVVALEAIASTVRGDVRGAFLWMAAALVIDSSDGMLARAARVKEVVPTYDGSKLDDIVDYLNYVFVPIFFAVETNLLPPRYAGFVAALPLLASAYGFCQSAAKTADFFFTGFPSYWNITVFYMYVLEGSPIANAVVLAVLSLLVFVPIGYLYPSRQPFLRPLTITLGVAWAVVVIVAVLRLPERSPALLYGSLAYPIYYFGLSFYLYFGRRRMG
jgi:phosphatidylcholine synthase